MMRSLASLSTNPCRNPAAMRSASQMAGNPNSFISTMCQAGGAADILTSDQPLEQAKAFALLSGLSGKMKFAPSGQQYETHIPVNC